MGKRKKDYLGVFFIALLAIGVAAIVLVLSSKSQDEPTSPHLKYVGIYHSDKGGGQIVGSRINDFYLYDDKTCEAKGENHPGRSVYIYNCEWDVSTRRADILVLRMTPPERSSTDTYKQEYAVDIVKGGILFQGTLFEKIK